MSKSVAIISEPKAVSFWEISKQIAEVLDKEGCQTRVCSWETTKIPNQNIIFVGNVFSLTISHLQRFLPDKNVIFYAVTEGNPLLDSVSLEISEGITYITPSNYAKQCLEAVGLKCKTVIPHGISLKKTYDTAFAERLRRIIPSSEKNPSQVMLCVAGNVQRKALDKLCVAYKIIQKVVKDSFLILHTGIGDFNIVALQTALDLKRFWFTNMWGVLDRIKLGSLFKICDFYVQPSLVEGFGLTYLEAFQYEKPVIGVNCPATNEIVRDQHTGLLIPTKRTEDTVWQQRHAIRLHHFDVDDLIDSMLIMTDENIRLRFAENAKKERHNWDMYKIYPRFLNYLT